MAITLPRDRSERLSPKKADMMDKMARRIGESFTWVMDMVMEGASKKQKALLPLLAVLMMGFPLQNHYNRWMAAVFDDTPISK